MKKSLYLLLMTTCLSLTSFAKELPLSDPEFLSQCVQKSDCELKLFYEISKTYRPSKDETEIRDYIIAIKEVSEKYFWKTKLEFFQDAIGNIMIRLPATGGFQKNQAYFALQSHMDMVLAYANAKPGEDIRPYFKNGVSLEIKDGWLQSKNLMTSIGVDNGIGVAIALRYLIDPSIAHPPLELIFTVQEETGLAGAFNSELPILSKKMLCLDGMTPEPGYVIAGAQGQTSNHLQIQPKSVSKQPSEQNTIVQVTVTDLAGGHSGGDIHRNRLNAMKAFAQLVKFVSSQVGPVSIKTVTLGDQGIFNKIPSLFQAELVIPKENVSPALSDQILTFMNTLIRANLDDAKNGKTTVFIKDDQNQKYLTTNIDFTSQFVDSILSAPNGVIDKNSAFYENVFSSTNLSYLSIQPTLENTLQIQLGHMTRSFSENRQYEIASTIIQSFKNNSQVENLNVQKKAGYAAWLEPDTSTLLQETLTTSGYFSKKYYLNGGLEPSAFKKKIQGLEVVALGPYLLYAHSVNERLKIDSIEPTVIGVRRIVQNQKR